MTAQPSSPQASPIQVNERAISEQEIAREMQYHPADSAREAREKAITALVIRALLLDEARRLGLDTGASDGESSDEAMIRRLLEQAVECPEPGEEDCRRWYRSNRARMRTADQHELSHILLPAPPDDAQARQHARAQADTLLAELASNPQRFTALAAKHSRCPSKDAGGYLGLIGRGQTVPEFERALSRAPTGRIAPYPLETRFGFHVVWIHQRHEGHELSYRDCRERIADYLREQVRRRAISQYVRILAGRGTLHGVDLGAAHGPLVQ